MSPSEPRIDSKAAHSTPAHSIPASDSELFVSRQTWNAERIHAIALYCSDGRWGEAFDEFCQERLALPRYDRFAVPGGPACIARSHPSLETSHSAAQEQVSLLVRVHELERIVLITHYGCAVYAELTGQEPDAAMRAQEADLRAAASTLRGWFAGVRVDAFSALRDGGRIFFREVNVRG